MKKKTILFLLVLVSNCFSQYIPQFLTQPPVGYQINLAHPKAQGLVGRWLFHEGIGNTVFDLSQYGNNGTLTNMDAATDWVVGSDGWALDFDGSDDYVNLGTTTLLIPPSISVCFWAKRVGSGDGNDYQTVVNRQIFDNSGYAFYFSPEATAVLWRVMDGTAHDITASVTTNEWHFYCGTFSNGRSDLFIDGVLKATDLSAGMTANSDATKVGASELSDTTGRFDGLISNVSIYNRALSAQEVTSNYINSYAMFEQPPGRILAVAAAAAAIDRMRLIIANP